MTSCILATGQPRGKVQKNKGFRRENGSCFPARKIGNGKDTLAVLADLTMEAGRSMRGTPAVWVTSAATTTPDLLIPRATVSNYPSPFNPMTTVAFEVPRNGQVSLRVHDLGGGQTAVRRLMLVK